MPVALTETNLPGLPKRSGKVRDVYDLGDRLLIVATDRISAFDWVLPNGIPDKGRILTAMSLFWFTRLKEPNHLISADLGASGLDLDARTCAELEGRVMIVHKADVVPFECVVRGYLAGSGWKEYQRDGKVCGTKLPHGLVESEAIHPPIFTPATKAVTGHDENVSFSHLAHSIGPDLARDLEARSSRLYLEAAEYARTRGLILADTKFEWGRDLATGKYILIDEVLTPDSSRYWPLDEYEPGGPQPSFDKQFVRDWLDSQPWDKNSPPPALPEKTVAKTRAKYLEALERLTGARLG
jgi:phosphoribosylaminoimidazole-succinocarboxamide synthase